MEANIFFDHLDEKRYGIEFFEPISVLKFRVITMITSVMNIKKPFWLKIYDSYFFHARNVLTGVHALKGF